MISSSVNVISVAKQSRSGGEGAEYQYFFIRKKYNLFFFFKYIFVHSNKTNKYKKIKVYILVLLFLASDPFRCVPPRDVSAAHFYVLPEHRHNRFNQLK